MFKMAWKWLKENGKGIAIFFTILAMGAGIMPTIGAGQAFVEALQFERMAEASPAYAVVRDVESQARFYVLSVEKVREYRLLWVLPSGSRIISDDKLDAELYVMFASLVKNYDAMRYIIIVAELSTAPTPAGFVLAFRGAGYFAITAEGAEQLIAAGIENANTSLTALYGSGDFETASLEWQAIYMTNLLPRAPGHIAPWEEEE